MLIASRGTGKQVTSQNDRFRHLCLVERFDYCKLLLNSSLAALRKRRQLKKVSSIQGGASSQEGRGTYVSPYGENPKKRPPVMMSQTITLRGRSEYIAER
jgi:hypothetical protein